MAQIKELINSSASVLLLLVATVALAASLSNVVAVRAFADTPTCDGKSCANDQPCGTQCVCNTNDPATCLDNTVE
jgi:hypothetical protein